MFQRAYYILCVFAVLSCSDRPAPAPKSPIKIGDHLSGGGIAFYVDASGYHGLGVASTDQGHSPWGWDGTLVSGANGSAIGTGRQNTLAILADWDLGRFTACDLTYNVNGNNGALIWYLPSKDELYLLYKSQYLVGLDKFNLVPDLYWSSTQNGADSAWSQAIDIYPSSDAPPLTPPGKSPKSAANRVRSIRSF